MKVLKIRPIQNCRQCVIMYDVGLDDYLTKPFIDHLSKLGTCEYFTNLPKLFFRINLFDKLQLKGAEGNNSFRIVLLESEPMENINELIDKIVSHSESYQN